MVTSILNWQEKKSFIKSRYLKHLKSYQELQQSATLIGQIPLRTNEVIALMGIILIFIYAFFLAMVRQMF